MGMSEPTTAAADDADDLRHLVLTRLRPLFRAAAPLVAIVTELLRAYGTIFFARHTFVGLLFFIATFRFTNTALAGILAAVIGHFVARLFRFPDSSTGLYIYNSLLVGLSLGATYHLDAYLLLLIVLGATLAVFATVALRDLLWRLDHLPVLSLPFVAVALTTGFAAKGYGNLSRYMLPMAPLDPFLWEPLDAFLTAMGSTFFIPHPHAGLIFFLGVLWTSRYLAILAVAGFAVGDGLFSFLSGINHPGLVVWTGFNFILTAMAVGGVFIVPGWRSFLLAMAAAAMSALITSAAQTVMLVYGLPVMALPFLLTTLLVLTVLRKRITVGEPILLLENPGPPEINYERDRLARVRTGDIDSTPLSLPFFGEWQIYQGFDGRHTHRPPWQHALDFFITENGNSFVDDGKKLEDYHCFALPVTSPVHGQVVRVHDTLADNEPGEVDTRENWGNFILIRLPSGLHVLLAHLRQHSIKVAEGSWVTPGQVIAACGNSGRSPQPHLHLHLQADAVLGGPTLPFHLVSVVSRDGPEQPPWFHLVLRPREKSLLRLAPPDQKLAKALHLPVGRHLSYRLRKDDGPRQVWDMRVELTLTGQFRLLSSNGGAVIFEEHPGVLVFFDRNDVPDPPLDLWLLALGLTPLIEHQTTWNDRPSAQLLPMNWRQRLLFELRFPLGSGLDSRYRRHWIDGNDGKKGHWQQNGQHRLHLGRGKWWHLRSLAEIDPEDGCTRLEIHFDDHRWEMRLRATGLLSDNGIPAWDKPVADGDNDTTTTIDRP